LKNQLNIRDAVYEEILDSIISLEFKPGEILNEKNLIEKYNCSKSPVREALLTLCNEGALRSFPRCGYEVVRLTKDDIFEMIQYRYALESGILEDSYTKIMECQLEHLEYLNTQCQDGTLDVWTHWKNNSEFHIALIGFSGNNYALDALKRCLSRLKRAYAQCYWNRWDTSISYSDTKNHRLIIEAIRNRDFPTIKSALANDLNDFGTLGIEVQRHT
jgi:DNA-binding GntR family transcriptional regulator